MRPERIVRVLLKCGLTLKHQTGSHAILTRPGLRRPVVVAMHNRELPARIVRDIIQQAGLTIAEFREHV